MRSKNLLIASAFMLFTAVASAALPPFYQSMREFKGLLEDARLQSAFGTGRAIESIVRNHDGYLVRSAKCSLQVAIRFIPLPQGMSGAARFRFDFPTPIDCSEGNGQ